jgi:transcription-repair coupling factor (superfamily II helicase)
MQDIQTLLNPAPIYYLLKNIKKFAIVVPNNKTAEKIKLEIELFSEYLKIKKKSDILYKNILQDSQFFDYEKFIEETSNLYKIFIENSIPIIVFESLFKKIPTVDKEHEEFKVGNTINIDTFSEKLLKLGYKYEIPVEEKGTFQIKGGIIDIFVPYYNNPIRIELFGDEIESIRFFDADFQTTIEEIKSFKLISSMNFDFSEEYVENFKNYLDEEFKNERISYDKMDKLLSLVEQENISNELIEYAPFFYKNSTTVFELVKKKFQSIYLYDTNNIISEIDEISNIENNEIYYDLKNLRTILDKKSKNSKKIFHISPLALEGLGNQGLLLNSEITSPYRIILQEPKTYFRLFQLLEENLNLNKDVIIFYVVEERKQKIKNILSQFDLDTHKIIWKKGLLKDAFQTDTEIFLSDYLILGVYSPPTSDKKMKNIISSFSDLNKGDYVVHTNYGIGRYVGIISKEINGYMTDFLEIHYDKEDKLFLPVYNLSLLYKHSSSDQTVKLDSFRSQAWENRKSRIKKSIEKIAQELIELYAQRMSAIGYQFSENDELYDSFSSEFPYVLTTDQDKTIKDIVSDMEDIKPMDRLVCGDVGFGKTEVAMRAAFKAVADNKQVAILAPTTVLSFQHYLTFKKRFSNFPIEVNFVSSFKSSKDKKLIFQDLKKGKIDILIGTQAILAKMVDFKSLGLLIIDEEHKFGVKDKEKLRELKLNIDTLAMTATPIPRTLNFSLSGIRDLSIINTPPKDRKSVKTVVMKKDGKRIKDAISYELNRGGQIFYIHNRISTIYQEADYLLEILPNIKLAIAHAELPKSKLEKLMMEFYDGKFDLLLSTNIIESGIDIPNANTMIIDRADSFGLASLYQLRGRVGRAEKQGYCILQLPKKGKITSIAERRLSVISRYTDLGSGFQIALQDMEIRGAGTLLGFAQKGHVDEGGYETYMNFLKEALAELKGDKKSSIDFKTELNTEFSAVIPGYYVEDEFIRLSFYKRLSNSTEDSEVDEIIDELRDQFGMFPEELVNFFNLVKIKIRAMKYKVSKITISKAVIYMVLDDPDLLNLVNLMPFLTKYPNIKFGQKNNITINSQFNNIKEALEYFDEIIKGIMVKV